MYLYVLCIAPYHSRDIMATSHITNILHSETVSSLWNTEREVITSMEPIQDSKDNSGQIKSGQIRSTQ